VGFVVSACSAAVITRLFATPNGMASLRVISVARDDVPPAARLSWLRGCDSAWWLQPLEHLLVATTACRHEFTRVKPGAVASERGDQQLSRGSNTRNVRVDLFELLLGHGSPSLLAGSGTQQLPDFGDREPGLLKKGDRRQPLQH
jgi:hypothetical protein